MARKSSSRPPAPAAVIPADPPAPAHYEPAWPVADLVGRAHPENPKVHPPEQLDALRESIRRLGWVKPLVLNRRTGRLADGHARLTLAGREGWSTLPVLSGDWDEGQEREILAYLDAIGALAGLDPGKFRDLRARLDVAAPRLRSLLGRLAAEPLLLRAPLAFPAANGNPLGPADPPPYIPRPELIPVASLRAHPLNYKGHPEDQVEHLAESIRAHGLWRNLVTARDLTVLAGHGLLLAARRLGLDVVPCVRLDLDPDSPAALKVLVGDNEIDHLGDVDDRALSEILRRVKDEAPAGLLGTGYDGPMLANLVLVTRPASEIADFDAASHWAGMPEYDPGEQTIKVIVSFRDVADRARFGKILGLDLPDKKLASTWWPPKERDDLSALRFEGS